MKNNLKLKLALLAAVIFGSIGGAIARDVPAMPLTAVQSWNYLIAGQPNTSMTTMLQRAASEEYDMIATTNFDGAGFGSTIPASVIEQFQNAKPGNIALSYILLSEFRLPMDNVRATYAEQATWVDASGNLTAAAPAWLTPKNPDFTGLYGVRFWYPEWRAFVLRTIDQMIAAGWDGVFLDAIPAHQFREGSNPWNYAEVVPDVDQKMVAFVAEIRAHVQSKNLGRPFYLIGNNAHYVPSASQLAPYLDGNVSESNIWSFDGNTKFMTALGDQSFESLNKAGYDLFRNAGKPNFSVEYIANNNNPADFEFYASALAYYGLIGSVTTSPQMQTHLEPQIFSNGTTACITSTVATITQTCTTRYAAPVKAEDYMFNWGERAYADVLRTTNEPSAVTIGYYNRYYPQGQIYIGTKDNELFYYQPNKSDEIVRLGKTSTWVQKALR
jgi:uncharacterized protein (TIGR01370 family)